ncbi:MAG: ATP-grasp domain-containing protein [Sandaracinaceae bacterium]|nr:ATP-grasp domain-containing protein [Myxococcales bacterium]MCB9656715.1 ATP-grasp domain-containing protein [Sandaracinaceae bacterium]
MKSVIVNAGPGAWGFEPLANALAAATGVPISETPAEWNYVLGWPESMAGFPSGSFVPQQAITLAADKRLLARAFERGAVPSPETTLVDSAEEARRFLGATDRYCLKYPTGVGAHGHRMLTEDALAALPSSWPRPLVVQAFIESVRPEVFRIYAVGGELLGFNVRRFPDDTLGGPWVSHARGGRYESAGEAPEEARVAARAALSATGLLSSFGCADLMRDAQGRWLVLEVGTDGVFNHVDRDVDDDAFLATLHARIAEVFLAGPR